MFALDEQTRMVQTMVRQWCETQLAPRIPAFEHGTELPFELMKKMARTFGLDAMVGAQVRKRIDKLKAAEAGGAADEASAASLSGSLGGDTMMTHVVVKELSRVSPGFAMGWGVSMGLAGGAILAKGTAAQVERWGLPLTTCKQIGSW